MFFSHTLKSRNFTVDFRMQLGLSCSFAFIYLAIRDLSD